MNDLMSNPNTELAGVDLTRIGINAPNGLTEEQWAAIAAQVAQYESGRAWFYGDLFNLWPSEAGANQHTEDTRKKRCEELGLNYQTMKNHAWVAREFSWCTRVHQLTFNHHKILASVEDPTERSILKDWAIDHGKIASCAALAKERDRRRGITKKATIPASAETTEELVHNVLDAVPKSTSKTTRKAIEREVKKAASTLSQEFDTAVHKAANEELKERRAVLREKEKKAEEKFEQYLNLHKNVDGILTREEFRFVRGVLHPDRAPADRKTDFTRAFRLFNRLEEAVNKWR